ncbi:MAG: DUF2235 domain-containing protein [Gammaproteobacteria bacterium]|nr:MAG: DUF2235 domain-containing protein [Gammaproteobacteria bacterium]
MKRIVLCLDGTWNRPDLQAKITNVVRLVRALRPTDEEGVPQVVYYHKGVGTGGLADRVRGGAFGTGLVQNLKDAYRFLANNYDPGGAGAPPDEIFLFVFSRGAYTARSLAGLIHWSGLLRKDALERVRQAMDAYRKKDEEQRAALLPYVHEGVRIRLVGVWDTVGALGIPLRLANAWNRRYRFHDTRLGPHIDYAFQALAIDERRGPFGPTLWQAPEGQMPPPDRVQQVWFPGVHSDVGGGYREHRLADLALLWLAHRAAAATGLAFDGGYLAQHLRPDPLAPQHDSLSPLYAVSRVLPFERVIGGRNGWVSRWSRLVHRVNRPEPGHAFANEMLHRAALDRLGQEVEVLGPGEGRRRIRYEPPNLRAAADALPVVEHDGRISPPDGTP